STQAITGKQLFEVKSDVSTIAGNTSKYLGGKADILKGTAPTYTIQKTDYSNVGAAFAGVDGSLTEIYKEL
ncbi:hypothetical protein, partial [Bartonella bilalgolemii]